MMQPLVSGTTQPGAATATKESLLALYRSDPAFRKLYASSEAEFLQQVDAMIALTASSQHFVNDTYHVVVSARDKTLSQQAIHVTVKRHDREIITSWDDLQAIKSQTIGPTTEASELFPSVNRLLDTANQYHLWAVLGSGSLFPQGYRRLLEGLGPGDRQEFNDHELEVHRQEGTFIHIAVKPLLQPHCRDWRSLQSIKNYILGDHCEAIELFPPQGQEPRDGRFHLIGLDDPDFWFPFGFQTRVVHDIAVGNARNRQLPT